MIDADQLGKFGVERSKIAVLGLGHVGLPTALGLAELGWEVLGADDDTEKVALLRSGKSWFYEPGLQSLLTKHLASGKFQPTHEVAAAIRGASVLFVCVGTPQRESGAPDLSQVEAVARTIAQNLNGYKLIIEKSTVPAITGQWIKRIIERHARAEAPLRSANGTGATPDFDVASNPEFLQEGKAVEDFFHPDRVVLGVDSERARRLLEEIYRPLECPILVTTVSTAELIKHAANAFLSTKISFINMISDVCEAVGADVEEVARGLGLDPRIGPDFLRAGIGFGGYCFPKDLRALIYLAEEHGVDCAMLREVEHINQRRIELFLRKMRKALWVLQGKTIAVLGLAFKPNTDDVREAPSLKVVEALTQEGVILRLYDPQAASGAQKLFPERPSRLTYCSSPYEAALGAHALLILTEWDEFGRLDWTQIHEAMETRIVVDGRNLFEPSRMFEAGFEYWSVGRVSAQPTSQREGQAETLQLEGRGRR